jgi:tRNA A37 threonylcarbamoyltransferase TsaD
MIQAASKRYKLDVVTCPLDLCVDNAAMIAWNAWELKSAE